MEAARAQIVTEVIEPALSKGAVVLCDRFTDSTIAYQAFGRGLDRKFVKDANTFAAKNLVPQKTIYMTCGNSADGLERATQYAKADRLESAGGAFHTRVQEGFLILAKNQSSRISTIDSSKGKAQTARSIFAALVDIFPWMKEAPYTTDDFFLRVEKEYFGNKHPLEVSDCANEKSKQTWGETKHLRNIGQTHV
jgi:dTMP kinase